MSARYGAWLDATLLLFLIAFIISGITLAPFHGDEAAYIWLSQDYDAIVKQGNLGAFLLNADIPGQGIRLSTGSILGFSIGFVRDVTGVGGGVINNWAWDLTWDENIEQGNMPNHQLLALSRACAASMGALSIVFLFLTARYLLGSRLSAWVATFLLATHGDVLLNFRRAMQEGPKFLFLLIALYLSTHILRGLKNNGEARRFLYVLLGIASGFTLATKQDTAPMLVAIYFSLALVPLWNKEKKSVFLVNILYLCTAGILAYVSFLALMPVFWEWWQTSLALVGLSTLFFQIPVWKTSKTAKPAAFIGCALVIIMTIISPLQWSRVFAPVSKMIELRQVILKNQINYRVDNDLFYLNTLKNKAKFLVKTVLTSNVMYMEVETFDIDPINQQIAVYESSYIHGRIGSRISDVFVLVLFVIGVRMLLRQFNIESLLMFLLFLITAVFIFVTVPLPWQRYYLIMQIPYSLIAGVGAAYVWGWGKQFIWKRVS